MFESPSNNQTNTTSTKPKLAKTFSNKSIVALKSQFDSGGSAPTSSVIHNTAAAEAKSIIASSPKTSLSSSLASTPAPTPTPPPSNPSGSKAPSGGVSPAGSGDNANSQKERRKLPATPKPSSASTTNAVSNKSPVKPTGSGGRSAVVASAKQASAGATPPTTKTPVSRTPFSGHKSTHRDHVPLHKKSSPNSGASSASPFSNSVKTRSTTAPIPGAHASNKWSNNNTQPSDNINNNANNNDNKQPQQGGIANTINKPTATSGKGVTSINRVQSPVQRTLSSPLTPPKSATNNVTISVNQSSDTNKNLVKGNLNDDKYQRLNLQSTTITTTTPIKTNEGIGATNYQPQQRVVITNNANSRVFGGHSDNRKISDDSNVIGSEKQTSSSASSGSISPTSASPPPPMLTPLVVPTVTVTLEPCNINNKKQSPTLMNSNTTGEDKVDTTVANNNFKNIVSMQATNMNSNSTITSGGRNQQYWTNQALQNDNSQKISEVNHNVRKYSQY